MTKPSFVASLAGPLLVVAAAGCPSVTVDSNETSTAPIVEFDPGAGKVPFPNNLAINPTTKKVTLPAQLCESPTAMGLRAGVLNKLDGYGTYEVGMTFTLTAMPDMTTAAANIKLFQLGASSVTEIPVTVIPSQSIRYKDASSCASPTLVPAVAIVPNVPLAQKSTFAVAVTAGLNASDGTAFGPSAEWMLVRSETDPVTIDGSGVVTANHTPIDPSQIDTLKGIDALWKAHSPVLTALASKGIGRTSTLLAWSFNTATVTDPLDPTAAMSVASRIPDRAFAGFQAVSGAGNGEAFLTAALPSGSCSLLPCNAVADVAGAAFFSDNYQQGTTNPLSGGAPVPGAWADPVAPDAATSNPEQIATIIMVPKGTMPTAGWPVVIFGHGLGSSKESLAVFGPQLAAAGFASAAIDFVDHGSRAVRTRNDAECADSGSTPKPPDPTVNPECFALFLSTDLAATRDNFRQTILDLQALTKALKKCGTGSGCANAAFTDGAFKIDPTKMVYAGISLGGIIGSTFNSVEPSTKAAVLNVPGVGLVDIFENTQTAAIRCSVVDALITAGVLTGDKWDGGTNGLCVAQDQGWKTQPGYVAFASVARWILDPGDGANFVTRLNGVNAKKYLIQEVVNDEVVPNIATDREAAILGFTTAGAADKLDCEPTAGGFKDPANTSNPCPIAPSAAIITNATTSKWVRYEDLASAARTTPLTGTFPGNDYQHASLLRPVYVQNTSTPSVAGTLGTLRIQTDAITFLVLNR